MSNVMERRPLLIKLLWSGISLSWLALLVTGALLWFFYRPTDPGVWKDIYDVDPSFRWTESLQIAHIAVAILAVLLPIAQGLLHATTARWNGAIGAAGLVVVAVAGWVSGQFLPWDQLALWAVTVGTNMDGYEPMFSDDVRFVLVDGAEVTPRSMQIWLFAHSIVLPVLVALGTIAMRRRRPVADSATTTQTGENSSAEPLIDSKSGPDGSSATTGGRLSR